MRSRSLATALLVIAMVFASGAARAEPRLVPLAAPAHADLPEPLRSLVHTRKARFAGAWGGYLLRSNANMLAVSANGLRAASAEPGSPVRIWDLETGRQLRVLSPISQDGISSLAFSPVDGHLAMGGHDGSITVWDPDTAKPRRTFKRHQGEVTALAWTPDGRRVASGGEDGTVRVWSLGPGRSLYLPGHQDVVRALAFFADGSRLASSSDDGTVRVWDLAKARVVTTLGTVGAAEALAVAVSPDGARLLVGREGIGVTLTDLATQEEQKLGSAPRVLGVGFAPDGGTALAVVCLAAEVRSASARGGSADRGELQSWDLLNGGVALSPGDAEEGLVASAFSLDGRRLLTSSGGGLTLWDLQTGSLLRHGSGHHGLIEAIGYSGDGNQVLTAAADGTARLWDSASGKELFVFRGHAPQVRAVAFQPSGGRVVIGDAFGLVRQWDLARLAPMGVIGPHRGVLAVSFSAEGRSVVSASLERVAAWDAETGKEVGSSWFTRLATAATLSGDGRVALVTDLADGPTLRESATGRALRTMRRPGRLAHTVLLTSDGTQAAMVTSPTGSPGSESLEIWDASEGRLLSTVRAPADLRLLAFSKRGDLLLGAGADGALRLWATRSARETDRVDLQANGEQPTAAAFAPDGLSFLVGTSTGALLHFLVVADPAR
ncbi:MAG: WD40 repeat domain-containing protein [Deltaproteobacteria bacterium]|nr:WD40 repeat domain-containing protein [Deltaproteobacteria bacterium]